MKSDVKNFGIKECREGTMIYPIHDMWLGKSIATYGESHYIESQFLTQLLKPGDTVVDAGSNIGTLTIPFAKCVGPKGKVYAFEAQRAIYHVLCGNVAVNSLENVQAMNVAVDRIPGLKAEVPLPSYNKSGAYGSVSLEDLNAETTLEVETISIDALGLESLKLMKIDVEGMEWDVIRGAMKTIKSLRPFIYFEVPNVTDAGLANKIAANLAKLQYNSRVHRPPIFNPNNFAGVKEDVLKNPSNPSARILSYNVFSWPVEKTADLEEVLADENFVGK